MQINSEWEKDSLTQTQEDLSPQTEKILNRMSEYHTTEIEHLINLKSDSREILALQRNILKLNEDIAEKNNAIQEILTTRTNSKRVYYLGLVTGHRGLMLG